MIYYYKCKKSERQDPNIYVQDIMEKWRLNFGKNYIRLLQILKKVKETSCYERVIVEKSGCVQSNSCPNTVFEAVVANLPLRPLIEPKTTLATIVQWLAFICLTEFARNLPCLEIEDQLTWSLQAISHWHLIPWASLSKSIRAVKIILTCLLDDRVKASHTSWNSKE